MAKGLTLGNYLKKPKKNRPGIHAKSKMSKLKSSKNYKKVYRGQGKWNYLISYLTKNQDQDKKW